MGDLLTNFANWLIDALLWVPKEVYKWLVNGLSAVLSAIPVPSWVSGLDSAFSSIPDGVLYFLSAFNFGYGVTVIMSAYALRFVIRRLPVIG